MSTIDEEYKLKYYWFGFIWRILFLLFFLVGLIAVIFPNIGIHEHIFEIVKHMATEVVTNNL